MNTQDPELGSSVTANGLKTNYHDKGTGDTVILIHGSGPGVTAYANWRLTIPELSRKFRVLAPDIAGFGYTERKPDTEYNLDYWIAHLIGFMDALDIERAHLIGNSFGGALTLALASRFPERVNHIVLMGSVGTEFELTPGLDGVWGYEPSAENMRSVVESFAYNKALATEDLIQSRYAASTRPGYQESYSRLFPPPRQRHISSLATPDEALRALPHEVLIVHGRDDQIIPLSSSLRLHAMIEHSDLHVYGECGHWTQIERKDDFARLIMDFLLENEP